MANDRKKLQLHRNSNPQTYNNREDAIVALRTKLATLDDGEIAMIRYQLGGIIFSIVGVVSEGVPTILLDEYSTSATIQSGGGIVKFDGFPRITPTIEIGTTAVEGGTILFDKSSKQFVYLVNGKYYNNFPGMENYKDLDTNNVWEDRAFIYNSKLYTYNPDSTTGLVNQVDTLLDGATADYDTFLEVENFIKDHAGTLTVISERSLENEVAIKENLQPRILQLEKREVKGTDNSITVTPSRAVGDSITTTFTVKLADDAIYDCGTY